MRYKVGDKVVLRGDIRVGRSYGDVYVSERLRAYLGEEVSIEVVLKGFPKGYEVVSEGGFSTISDTMIDHDKSLILFQRDLVEGLKKEECLRRAPAHPLQPSIEALGELHIKNNREIDWKLNDIEQWGEEIAKAQTFVDSLETVNDNIYRAIKVLEANEVGEEDI